MSVLIKDLKIPRVGVLSCVVAVADNRLLISDVNENTIFEGEYAEVPTPHGRLIDVDKLKCPLSWQGEIVRATVREAPTIIEAEVGE